MSAVSTSMPARDANASTIGLREYVANSGASSVRVQMIFAIMLLRFKVSDFSQPDY